MSSTAEKQLLTYTEIFPAVISIAFSTNIGADAATRMVSLRSVPTIGFCVCTNKESNKVQQLLENPLCIFSFLPKGTGVSIPVAHCTAIITQELDIKKKAWNSDLTGFGYTGPEDPKLCVVLLSVNSLTVGKTSFDGVPRDLKIYEKKTAKNFNAPSLGPFQDKEGFDLLKGFLQVGEIHTGHLVTHDLLELNDRIVEFHFDPKHGFFFHTVRSSNKVRHLINNPSVSVNMTSPNFDRQIAVKGVCFECTSPDARRETWNDSMKKYGLTGPDDPSLVMFSIYPKEITDFADEGPKIFSFHPHPYTLAVAKYHERFTLYESLPQHPSASWVLSTMSSNGRVHSRLMYPLWNPALGPMIGTQRGLGLKLEDIQSNPNVALTAYFPGTGETAAEREKTLEEDNFEAIAVIRDTDAARHSCWCESLRSGGGDTYSGPDDARFVPCSLVITKAKVVRFSGEPTEQLQLIYDKNRN